MNIARYQDKKKKKNLKSKTPAYKNRNIASDVQLPRKIVTTQ